MLNIKSALLVALPLFFGSMAMAQPVPPDGNAPAQAGEPRHPDFAAWHKEMCSEHFARQSSHLAYLQAKLGLTDQQQAVWTKYRQTVLDQDTKEKSACLEASPKGDAKPTAIDHAAHQEKVLTLELQSLQATRPALEALYQALTPEQKTIFDRADFGRHGPHDGGPMGHEHMGHGPMGHEPADQGPMGHGPQSED